MVDKILIIGNGFDLYHNLPTRYKDFLFFCNHWNEFIDEFKKRDFNSLIGEGQFPFVDIQLSEKGELIIESLQDFAHYDIYDNKHIEFLSENILNNGWLLYFNKILPSGNNWIDFEGEIQKALKIVEEYYASYLPIHVGSVPIINMNDSMSRVINTFKSYASNKYVDFSQKRFHEKDNDPAVLKENKKILLMGMYDELNKLITCLNYYLFDFVSHIRCNYFSRQIKALGNNIYLLNFNYTYTYAQVYRKGEEFYHHPIHGELKEDNMVLGISDDAFDGTDYIYFQKYFQRIQKKTGNYYKEWLRPLSNGSLNDIKYELYIMGHSLDVVDKGILKDFFENENRIKKIKIYYYNQEAYEKIVINLINMFDKDFVIEQTGRERIVFEELEKRRCVNDI